MGRMKYSLPNPGSIKLYSLRPLIGPPTLDRSNFIPSVPFIIKEGLIEPVRADSGRHTEDHINIKYQWMHAVRLPVHMPLCRRAAPDKYPHLAV
jgi:hypothetical protein